MRRIVYSFSKLKIEDIETSNYKQLVEKMAKLYGYQQFKTKSSLSLLQIHHQHSIFKQGYNVLNISSGTAWAELIVKHTRSPSNQPSIITVSQTETLPTKGTHLIKGKFDDTQTKVRILEHLKDRKFDLAVMNILPRYSGFVEIDGFKLNGKIINTLIFLDRFLKKGGTFVCKAMNTKETKELDKSFQKIFKSVYKYKVSFIRSDSPMFYYILKGFGMGKQSLLLNEFNLQYNKPNANKKLIIKKFQQKGLDAQTIARNGLRQKIQKMMNDNQSEDKILRETSREYFLDPQSIINKIKQYKEIVQSGTRKQAFDYIKRQYGDSYKDLPLDIPEDDVESMDVLQKVSQSYQPQRPEKKGRKTKKVHKNKADELLGRDEIYMQQTEDSYLNMNQTLYLQKDVNQDVAAQYNQDIEQQLQKFKKIDPQFQIFYNKFKNEDYSFQELSKYMGTHELYDPEHDEIKTELNKKIQKDQQNMRRSKTQYMSNQSINYEVKGARSRAYIKNKYNKSK